jgi:P27 family predicted phage terminase small subunit
MQGRKPKPTALKLITGNPGKRPIRFDEFKPAAGIPRCPKHVKGEAKKEWQRITQELMRYGMVSEIDRGLLAMICTTWAKYVEAEEMIEKARAAGGSGLFVKTPNGFPVVSPWMVVSNKAIEVYKSLCAEHCLTQATRARATPGDMQGDLFGIEGGKTEGFASL